MKIGAPNELYSAIYAHVDSSFPLGNFLCLLAFPQSYPQFGHAGFGGYNSPTNTVIFTTHVVGKL